MTFPQTPVPQPPVFKPRPFQQKSPPFLPYTDKETQEFLEDTSDLDDTIKLWDTKAKLTGILTARMIDVVQQARQLAEVYFDFTTGRYKYIRAGRRIPDKYINSANVRLAKSQELAFRDLTKQLIDGEISDQQWYNSMRKMMKDQYRASYIASIGGVENYTRSEISKFGWRVRPQYRWLDNFLIELQNGKQPKDGRAVIRAGMYARAGNAIYQNNLLRIAEQNGMTMARRVLGVTDQHCHDSGDRPGCVELAAKGFVPIGQAVEIGSASCYSNCLCSFEFRK